MHNSEDKYMYSYSYSMLTYLATEMKKYRHPKMIVLNVKPGFYFNSFTPMKMKITSLCYDIVNRYMAGEGGIVKNFEVDINKICFRTIFSHF